MQQETITQTVTKATLTDILDFVELVEWAKEQPDLYAIVIATCDGELKAEAGGRTVDTVYADQGDTIIWNGVKFDVEKPTQS